MRSDGGKGREEEKGSRREGKKKRRERYRKGEIDIYIPKYYPFKNGSKTPELCIYLYSFIRMESVANFSFSFFPIFAA